MHIIEDHLCQFDITVASTGIQQSCVSHSVRLIPICTHVLIQFDTYPIHSQNGMLIPSCLHALEGDKRLLIVIY